MKFEKKNKKKIIVIIIVWRGVLQGDCLSPLLFNLCFNTFFQHIKADQYCQNGFFNLNTENGNLFSLNPLHWFQCADHAAVVTGQETVNQTLLNRFTLWCQWADINIRVDKCVKFGIKKASSKSVQYQPKLLINNQVIPFVKNDDTFRYLGRHFDFEMINSMHKAELSKTVNETLAYIDLHSLHPKNKILLYSRHLKSI